MKLHEKCLTCMINQTMKVLHMTGSNNREEIYRSMFQKLAEIDFTKTTPEYSGDLYQMIRQKLKVDDPYAEIRQNCNQLMLNLLPDLRKQLRIKEDPFRWAVYYAILGNIIDFSAPGLLTDEVILNTFASSEQAQFAVDETEALRKACSDAKQLLYIGDNCGEIVTDVLLLEEIHRLNPEIECTYVVRATPVVNDVIASDAETCGILPLARLIDTGETCQGIVIDKAGESFMKGYRDADVVISKGQGNYEGLSEYPDEKIFCLLMAKCDQIAQAIGVSAGDKVVLRLSPEKGIPKN